MKRRVFLKRASLLGVPFIGAEAVTANENNVDSGSPDSKYPVGDVRRYGATGNGKTDDSAAIQRAVNDSLTVHFPEGDYLVRKKIDLRSGSSLVGDGSATLRTDGNSYLLSAVGTIGSRQRLRNSVLRADQRIAVAGGTVNSYQVAGGYFLQSDRPPLGHPTHRSGEIGLVSAVGPNDITILGGTLADYQISDQAKAAPLKFIDGVTIRGLRLSNDNYVDNPTKVTSALIYLEFVKDFRIFDCSLVENNSAGIAVFSCLNGTIGNNTIGRMRDGRGGILGYGIQVGFSSQSITISGNSFFECRHAVTTGTGTKSGRTPNYGVSRGLAITGNSVSYCTNTGLDTHEDSDGVTISGNTIVACTPVGIHVRSFGSTITGNTISACKGKGIRISKTAKNSVASANVIRNIRRRSSDGDGIVIDSSAVTVSGNHISECDRHGISVEDNAIEDIAITGNTCLNNGQTMAGDGINISRRGSISKMTVSSNACSDNQPRRTQRYNFSIEAGTSITESSCLIVDNNFASSESNGFNNRGAGTPRMANNLGHSGVGQLRPDSQAISVANGSMFRIITPGVVDTLKGGVVGQSIQLVADNGATIRNSSNIRLQGGQNYQMRHGDTLQLTMFRDQVWQEIGRSINTG